MKVVRLLVVSPPCYQPINRAVYRELSVAHGIAVHLAVPDRLHVGGVWRPTPPSQDQGYSMSLHPISGTHGRLQTMQGLAPLAVSWQPTHVLIDSDPASRMVLEAARSCPDAEIWAMTAENLPAKPFSEFCSGVVELDAARAVAPLLKLGLRTLARRRVRRVFTLSLAGSQTMAAMGFTGRVTQIPLGFDPALFRVQEDRKIAETRALLGLREPTIAYFGRLAPEKGVHLLLEALAGLKDRSWQLLIDRFTDYPSPYAATILSKLLEYEINDRVIYFDARHEQMPDFMNAADMVVLASISTPRWKEQYGRVLPEAMACGKQVIGSDSGAIPELVSDFGDICPEGNVTALRETIRGHLDRGNYRAHRDRISSYAHQHLSIRRQAQIWADLLK